MQGVFERHAALFSREVGIAQVSEHSIRLVERAAPKRSRPYRMPVALKDEVSKQISELLELGLIYRCESPFAHPLVCVPKTARCGCALITGTCVDYRITGTL